MSSGGNKTGGNKMQRKQGYFTRISALLEEYNKIMVVTADNVGSHQMQKIRMSLRGDAVLLMGKNTMIRKAIRGYLDKKPDLETILPYIKQNIGLVFTDKDLSKVRSKLLELKVQAPAKAGAIAPVDVVVPAQQTSLEPTKTSFFQALSIPTKINKGAIEITSDIALLSAGDRVTVSQASLLLMLAIKPFNYGLNVKAVYDNGSVFPASVLDITDEDILKKFFHGVNNVAALGLQVGYPTVVSVPHSLINGYKNLIAIALELEEYSFPAAKKLKDLLSDPEALARATAAAASSSSAAAPASSGAAAPTKEDKVDEQEPDDTEGVDLGGGLFGGGDDDW